MVADHEGIADRVAYIRARIAAAAGRVGRRPESVRLIAATKTVSPELIRAAVAAGVYEIGENRFQEALSKQAVLPDADLVWHFIGTLQRRKVKAAVGRFSLIHSIDSVDLAREIDRRAQEAGVRQNVLLEINIAQEPTKAGFSESAIPQVLTTLNGFCHIAVKGFMVIPPAVEDPEQARPYFRAVRRLTETWKNLDLGPASLDELSMGMTNDFEVAIEEGATMVRIGTGIFGCRPAPRIVGDS